MVTKAFVEYRFNENDMYEPIEELDDMDKLGQGLMRTSIPLLHPQPLLLYILDQLLELAHAN